MSAKVEKLENNEVKLTITIGADKFEEGMQKAFFRNAKYFSVPGFRKGWLYGNAFVVLIFFL